MQKSLFLQIKAHYVVTIFFTSFNNHLELFYMIYIIIIWFIL